MISDREQKNTNSFYEAVASLKTPEECKLFFEDVATIKELIDLSSRLEVARMLDDHKKFSEIIQETGASSATISRVNRCLTYGDGGYRLVLDRTKK